MRNLSKTIGATVALAALTVGAATPAFADRGRDRDDGISVGDVIAGAVIIGGIAAILSSGNDNNDRYYEGSQGYGYNGGYDNRGYNNQRGGNGRRAVEKCVAAVEQRAGQGYGYANVTEIRQVDRTRNGLRVKGRLQVQQSYGRHANTDNGKFTCHIQQGRVVGLDISGIDQRQYRGNNGGYYQGGRGW